MKKFKFSWRWFEIGLVFLSLLIYLYVAFSPANSLMKWYNSDDAFYYYKVAVNLTSGHGLTFDGINRTNGFHPLWMAVCIPVFTLARFNLILPLRTLVLVSALLNAGTGILLFRILRKFISFWTAAATAVIWIFSPAIYATVVQYGMESAISAFFLALLLYLAVTWRDEHLSPWKLAILGCVAGLTILARLDNIFIVMLLGLWFVLGTTSAYLRTVIVGDLTLVFVAGLLSYYLRLRAGFIYSPFSIPLFLLIGLGFILKPLCLFIFKLYKPVGERFSWNFLGRCVLAVSVASLILGGVWFGGVFLKIFAAVPRSVLVIDWLITLLGVLGLRVSARILLVARPEPATEGTLFSWKSLKPTFIRALGYYFPMGLILGGYMAFDQAYVGTAMPVSGQIKYWWGTLSTVYGSGNKTFLGLFGIQNSGGPWQLAITPIVSLENLEKNFLKPNFATLAAWFTGLLLFALVLFLIVSQWNWLRERLDRIGIVAIFAGLLAQIFSYTSTAYIHTRPWYWVGETFFTVLCLGILMECFYLYLQRFQSGHRIWQVFIGIGSLALLALFGLTIVQSYPYSVPLAHQQDYLLEPRGLEAATEPGALIGMTGGGTDGYFIQGRTIVNLDGLINSPEYFRLLRAGKGTVLLDRIGLDYVFGSGYMVTESDPYRGLLDNHIEELTRVNDWILYRYLPSP